MRFEVIIAACMLIAAVSCQDRPAKRFQIQELDHPYVLSRRHATFFAGISRSAATCGWLKDYHETACFYCVDEICDSLNKDDILFLHHEIDGPGCTNEMRVLTRNHEGGACGTWISRIAMITPEQ